MFLHSISICDLAFAFFVFFIYIKKIREALFQTFQKKLRFRLPRIYQLPALPISDSDSDFDSDSDSPSLVSSMEKFLSFKILRSFLTNLSYLSFKILRSFFNKFKLQSPRKTKFLYVSIPYQFCNTPVTVYSLVLWKNLCFKG